jgi:hypothetical protein
MQLLHDEKIPPANVKARMEKIMVTLTLLGESALCLCTATARSLVQAGFACALMPRWSLTPQRSRPSFTNGLCVVNTCCAMPFAAAILFGHRVAEAPRGSGQVADEAARACVSRVLPGGPTLTELTCQAVTPGRKYWLQANMFCKVWGAAMSWWVVLCPLSPFSPSQRYEGVQFDRGKRDSGIQFKKNSSRI